MQAASFYKSIDEVNIGAFPLRPKDTENRKLLNCFIQSLLSNHGQTLIEDAIPQKGLNYIIDEYGTDSDMAFVGYVRQPSSSASKQYIAYYESFFKNDAPTLYYSGKKIRKDIDLRSVKYLFTNIPGNGYYRIKRIYTALRKELVSDRSEHDTSMRICYELGEFVPLGDTKIQFDWVEKGHDLHIPAEGIFMSLKHVKKMYQEYLTLKK